MSIDQNTPDAESNSFHFSHGLMIVYRYHEVYTGSNSSGSSGAVLLVL